MRIDPRAGVNALFGIARTARSGVASGSEVLAVRRRGCPVVPDRRHGMLMVHIDDGSASSDVIVVADMPLRYVDEVEVTEATRCIGHAGETEIGPVGEYRRQQRGFVGSGIAGAQMHEPIREASPRIDIAQHL